MKDRIPAYASDTPDGMLIWFMEMSKRGLLFHPEDDPAEIIDVQSRDAVFTDSEAATVRGVLQDMQSGHGHDAMIEACYPVFMRAAGQRLDA